MGKRTTVLVVDGIPPDRYEEALERFKEACRKKGLKPRVVEVSYQDLYMRDELAAKYGSPADRKVEFEALSAERWIQLAIKHVDSFGSVRVVVMSVEEWLGPRFKRGALVDDALDAAAVDSGKSFQYWIIHPDGRVEIA